MRRRALVYGTAAALLTVAFVLALARVGEEAGKALRLAGVHARHRPGADGAAADLLVRTPDPRPLARPTGATWTRTRSSTRRSTSRCISGRSSPSSRTSGTTSCASSPRGSARSVAWRSRRRTRGLPGSSSSRRFPAALAGAIGADAIETHLGQPWQIAINLAVFAVLLWVADRSAQDPEARRRWASGQRSGSAFAQALSLDAGRLPLRRITITAGRFLRLDRDSAARLSFLLLVPVDLRRRPLQGSERRGVRGPSVRLDRPVPRRHDRRRGSGPDRDRAASSATCGATTTRCSSSTACASPRRS